MCLETSKYRYHWALSLKNTALNMQLLLKDKTSLKTKIMKNNTQFFWSEERFTRPIVRSRLLMSSWM